jgi:hypothetical protein
MLRVGFEPAIPESERPQTYPLDRAEAGTGRYWVWSIKYIHKPVSVYVQVHNLIY